MENVNTNLEEIFNALFPTDGLEPEGFCINSRDLHKAMGVGKMYANWIKGHIAKHNFEEGYDYIIVQNLSLPNPAIANSRSQTMIDYYVTREAAEKLLLIESLKTSRTSSDNIYLIQNTTTKSVKIGVSKDVEGRLNSLQTGHEYRLKLVYTKPVKDALELESKLHQKFSNKRVRGEWFKVNPEKVIKEVEELTPKGLDHLRQKL